jgi:hypothetical protein
MSVHGTKRESAVRQILKDLPTFASAKGMGKPGRLP